MFQNVTLEMSLKPFKQTDSAYIRQVCLFVFEQWKPLLKNAGMVSILLWTADGSEILDYKGKLDDSFEWCRFVGTANPPDHLPWDPEGRSLHARGHDYMENPPQMTYGILKEIVSALKQVGAQVLPGKTIRVGETFDIGPEFAKSDFKYRRHPELCKGHAMNAKCFIDSCGILKADSYPYVGFPNGVPEGTPFGTFFGRQSNLFLQDIGFDYLWLSNGVGFSAEPWESKGAVFDGTTFHPEQVRVVRERLLEFWRLFREECPSFPLETRGTNFSLGIDYATDAVPLYELYHSNLNLLPPPNSPWAALDGNFGLELMGHMTRIADLPGKDFLFRYYVHDPWWLNSPWYDRYEGQPHDIYLPMSIGRVDAEGRTHKASYFSILSIDNCWGDLPDACANEPIPHMLKAEKDGPDHPAPLTWVYPFREYTAAQDEAALRRMFSNDWFVCGAINHSVPVSAVISTDHFIRSPKGIYEETILLSPVPDPGSPYEEAILRYVRSGGKVLFYGGVDHAGDAFLRLINIRQVEGAAGVMDLKSGNLPDTYSSGRKPDQILFDETICAGRCNTVLADPASPVQAVCTAGDFVLGTFGGHFGWYRGPLGSVYELGCRLLKPQDPSRFVHGESLLRTMLEAFGFSVRLQKPNCSVPSPVWTLSRCDNAFWFSSYFPSTTVEMKLKLPQGAPLLLGYETLLQDGYSCYRLPRAEHRECRIFVTQKNDSLLSCKEVIPVEYHTRRRLEVTGLQDATVRFYPESYAIGDCQITLNPPEGIYYRSDPVDFEWKGNYCEIRNVTGRLVLAMYNPKKKQK